MKRLANRHAPNRQHQRGSVLVTGLILIAVVTVVVASAGRFIVTEMRMGGRSRAWMQAFLSAEAGVEVAMQAFNRDLAGSADAWTKWTSTGTNIHTLADIALPTRPGASHPATYSVIADQNTLAITSSGTVEVPRFDAPVTRTVEVVLALDKEAWPSPFDWGLLAKNQLKIVGNPYCASYDSRNGPYGGTNILQNCDIGGAGARADAIWGGGATQVLGDAAVIPGADVLVNPAEFWTGSLRRDLEIDFPAVVLPRSDLTMGPITGNTTINVAGDTYVGTSKIRFSGPRTLRIRGNGNLTLYVDEELDIGTPAAITFEPDPGGKISVRLFLNGDAHIQGDLNTGGVPVNLQIYGTENCKSIDCQANNNKSLAIYAPDAEVHLSGTSVIQGSAVGEIIRITGNFDFRYDEALGTIDLPIEPPPMHYSVKSWMEL